MRIDDGRQRKLMSRSEAAPAKRATNSSRNARTLDMARELGMNISQTVDALLAEEVQRRYWARWNEDQGCDRGLQRAHRTRRPSAGEISAQHLADIAGRALDCSGRDGFAAYGYAGIRIYCHEFQRAASSVRWRND